MLAYDNGGEPVPSAGSGNVRIAMWSGPRTISTAMMRAWDARPDTFVCDEPLYAHYLQVTDYDHPGADEIIAHHEPDWRKVVGYLTGPIPHGKTIHYQKHMAHHLLPQIDRGWVRRLTNCFLIREPREMLASLAKVLPSPTVKETGLPQQVELFKMLSAERDQPAAVILAEDVLTNPAGMLRALCERVGVPYTDVMLSWKPGPRETDGIWAKHWYANVERSTGFGHYTPKDVVLPDRLLGVLDECQRLFDVLHGHRLTAARS